MQHDKTRRLLRGLNPDAQTERIDTRKMPEPGKREAILTAQFGGVAKLAVNKLWIFVNVGPFVGRGQIGDLVRNDLVESEVTGQSLNLQLLWFMGQPIVEVLAAFFPD